MKNPPSSSSILTTLLTARANQEATLANINKAIEVLEKELNPKPVKKAKANAKAETSAQVLAQMQKTRLRRKS